MAKKRKRAAYPKTVYAFRDAEGLLLVVDDSRNLDVDGTYAVYQRTGYVTVRAVLEPSRTP